MAATKNKRIIKRVREKKEEMLQKLSDSSGIVATACKQAGISRVTFYDWCRTDPDFAEKVEDIKELQKDFCEALILKKMRDGDTTMIIFYAKTRMKDRGYVERQEVTGVDGKPLVQTPQIDLSTLTDEQRAVLLSIGEKALNDTQH